MQMTAALKSIDDHDDDADNDDIHDDFHFLQHPINVKRLCLC